MHWRSPSDPRLPMRRTFGAAWASAEHLRSFRPLFVTHGTGYGLLSRDQTGSQLPSLPSQALMDNLG